MSSAPENEPEFLEPIGSGEQGFVYGTDRWVVKVGRFSVLGFLGKWISRSRWQLEVRDSLGGLAAPFLLLDEVSFDAPKMTGRRERMVTFHQKCAVALARYDEQTFLDHRLSLAEPAEALALVEEMVGLIERVRARGFYMHDFIMRNFVVVDGRLMIADTGLVVPIRSFWEPGMRICAWGFWRGLSKDYQRLLGELLEEVGDDHVLREKIESFRAALPGRLKNLRCRPSRLAPEAAQAVEFDAELEKEIRAALGSVR